MNVHARRFHATAAYRGASQTEGPARQIVLLYDAAILRLTEARTAIAENRIEDRFRLVIKAFDIVQALHACLDFEQGREIAPLLRRYYGRAMNRMLEINRTNDPTICDEVVAYLRPMRDSWAQIAGGPAPGVAAVHAAAAAESTPHR
jgi:flagellar protein FliS